MNMLGQTLVLYNGLKHHSIVAKVSYIQPNRTGFDSLCLTPSCALMTRILIHCKIHNKIVNNTNGSLHVRDLVHLCLPRLCKCFLKVTCRDSTGCLHN